MNHGHRKTKCHTTILWSLFQFDTAATGNKVVPLTAVSWRVRIVIMQVGSNYFLNICPLFTIYIVSSKSLLENGHNTQNATS